MKIDAIITSFVAKETILEVEILIEDLGMYQKFYRRKGSPSYRWGWYLNDSQGGKPKINDIFLNELVLAHPHLKTLVNLYDIRY